MIPDPQPTLRPRCILHLDMDAFYASVERLDHPEWRHQPLIVAGLGPRGVVTTASYEARAFGVRSAMSTAQARRLCPHGIFVPPRLARYAEISAQVMACVARYSDQWETLSLDEVFVDLGGSLRLFGNARAIADALQRDIRVELGLSASLGIAPNKLLAKLASESAKPGGIRELKDETQSPGEITAFLADLPLRAMWGVGAKTQQQLESLGLTTVADLLAFPLEDLRAALGSFADTLRARCLGQDHRPVLHAPVDQSISAERTFDQDVDQWSILLRELMALTERVGQRLRAQQLRAGLVRLKLRLPNFSLLTRQAPLHPASDRTNAIHELARELLQRWWTQTGTRARVRLLGVGVAHLVSHDVAVKHGSADAAPLRQSPEAPPRQADLFAIHADTPGDTDHEGRLAKANKGLTSDPLDALADRLNARFGLHSLRHARALPSSQRGHTANEKERKS